MDARTLKFGKNGARPQLAFANIDAAELYPVVVFYSMTNAAGETVRVDVEACGGFQLFQKET